ncbi:MAG: DNA-binding response regulator [Desulfobacteraceae bacterium]|nr:MAG: DNA-binding response regulator [Desulfobacteraceae bacterium]
MTEDKIKIIIVEDHPIFRMGIEELINREPDMAVCGDAEDVDTARDVIAHHQPDLVIVDLTLKNSNGIELIKEMVQEEKHLSFLVLSMHDESLHAERCILAGAKGYIMKQEASESVVTAVRQIISGNIYVSPAIMSNILNKFRNQPETLHESPLKRLTDREIQIFQLIGKGLSPSEMSGQLNISVKTIGTYRERIKEKLCFKHGSELVRTAVIWVETGIFKQQ